MPDYQQGKIYTIRCRTDDTLIYVGSTTQPLAKRWGGHKKSSKEERCKNRLIYTTINENWDNWYIELHSLYPCNSKEELCRKEGEIIREIGTLNVVINSRTDKEHYQDNKEKLIKIAKEYYEKNKDKIKEKITCECGCIINKSSLNKHRKTQKHLLLTKQIKYEFVEDTN
jgi:hypothetical protein